jgi:hypothetical protein
MFATAQHDILFSYNTQNYDVKPLFPLSFMIVSQACLIFGVQILGKDTLKVGFDGLEVQTGSDGQLELDPGFNGVEETRRDPTVTGNDSSSVTRYTERSDL